jgi:hypothetical protein
VHPLQEISYDEYDADSESDDPLDFGRAEGKAPTSLQRPALSFKQFANRMGQPNCSAFNKWKKV